MLSSNEMDLLSRLPMCLFAALAIEVGVERNFVEFEAIKRGGLGTTKCGVLKDDDDDGGGATGFAAMGLGAIGFI